MPETKCEGERVQQYRVLEDEEKEALEVVENLYEKIPVTPLDQDHVTAGACMAAPPHVRDLATPANASLRLVNID